MMGLFVFWIRPSRGIATFLNLCVYKKDAAHRDPVSEWPESQRSLARALYILDLSTQHGSQPNWI